MIDILSGLISSFQAIQNIAKSMLDIREFQNLNAKVVELQQIIISAQNQAMTAQQSHSVQSERIRELENECMRLKDWSAEKQRYSAREIAPGVFACIENTCVGGFQGAQKLCTNCFEQGNKSLLQQSLEEKRHISLSCHRCKAKTVFHDSGYLT